MFNAKSLKMKHILLVCGLLLSFLTGRAEEAAPAAGEEFNPSVMITHHIKDDHVWEFAESPAATFYLPVILSGKNGLEVFSARNFYTAEGHPKAYNGYVNEHGHIYYANEEGEPQTDAEGHHVGPMDFSITKNVASLMISVVLLLFVFLSIAGSYNKNRNHAPRGMQSFFEPIILFIRDDIAKQNIGKPYQKYMPLLLTVFFFIWFNNMLGLIPGGANLTGNIAVTMVLACVTFVVTLVSANGKYWAHIFKPHVPLALYPIIVPIEIIGIFTKPFALMIRLFANITAGHVIILSLLSLIFIFKSIAVGPVAVIFATVMNMLELFVALLQAYIFTLLTSMYIGSAVEDEHHEAEAATAGIGN